MTRVGAWVRAQLLFGFGNGAVRSSASKRARCQVGFMDFDPLVSDDDSKTLFVMLGWGESWGDAVTLARTQAKEWKENGWWPRHLRQ